MINLLCILTLYRSTIISLKYFEYFKSMRYGFNKNSEITIKITNLTSPILFGLSTTKELKSMNAIETLYPYCHGETKLSEIQFLIINDTLLNFRIGKKNILTPFSISCSDIYGFIIEYNVTNGKYDLDYRYQEMITIEFIFIILFIIEAIINILVNKLSKKFVFRCQQVAIFFVLFTIPHVIQSIFSIFSILPSNNVILEKSFFGLFDNEFNITFICNFFYFFLLYCSANSLNLELSSIISSGVLFILIICLIILSIIRNTILAYFGIMIIYLIHVGSLLNTPFPFPFTKIAFIFYSFVNFFGQIMRFFYDQAKEVDITGIITKTLLVTRIFYFLIDGFMIYCVNFELYLCQINKVSNEFSTDQINDNKLSNDKINSTDQFDDDNLSNDKNNLHI